MCLKSFSQRAVGVFSLLALSVELCAAISSLGLSGDRSKVAEYLNAEASPSTLSLVEGLHGEALKEALSSISPARNAYSQYVAAQTAFSFSTALSLSLDRYRFSDKIPLERDKGEGFLEAFITSGHLGKAKQNPGFNYFSEAALAGADYHRSSRALVGAAVGYAHTHYYDNGCAGHGHNSQYVGSLYSDIRIYHGYIAPAFWGMFTEVSEVRRVVFTGFSQEAKAHLLAWQMMPKLSLGFFIERPWGYVNPFMELDWFVAWQRSYQEKGASPFNAKEKQSHSSQLRAEAGVKFYQYWDMPWGTFILKEKTAYALQKLFGVGNVFGSFIGMGGVLNVRALRSNINLGIFQLDCISLIGKKNPWEIDVSYEGEFGVKYYSNSLTLNFVKHF
ncbi:MAG: autotransporter outer membrane beta-barrel domain-containing protein [Chlamydiae bacterium]|nr:autotransporter outer membrane beta-barrel domain-containing protein [Chlamydiota bacterium]